MLQLFFGTKNRGKLRELRRLVAGLPVEVTSPEELDVELPEVVEDGHTFKENAEKKAAAYACLRGRYALADDSGLCVDALGGAPGIFSARWSEVDRDLSSPACELAREGAVELGPELVRAARDAANNEKLLASLDGVAASARGASYVAVLALADPKGEIVAVVEGVCPGRIGLAPRGEGGFGYDPLFVPLEAPGASGRTMAELDPSEKDAISHRGRAFRALRAVLAELAFDKSGKER